MSECYKNVCPDVVGILVRVLQECCPGVARIINSKSNSFCISIFISDIFLSVSLLSFAKLIT